MDYQRIEVITGTPRRRRYTEEQKAAAVMDSMAPGASIAEVARQHGICRSLLFRWRQLAQASAPAFVPVILEPPQPAQAAVDPEADAPSGGMELVLADGRMLRFDAEVDVALLRRVLGVLSA